MLQAENNMEQFTPKEIQQLRQVIRDSLFTGRKPTDTPTDALDVVPRKYVTNNGLTASRPTSSVVGQPYLDMTLASGRGKPIWYNGTGWIDATGTYT